VLVDCHIVDEQATLRIFLSADLLPSCSHSDAPSETIPECNRSAEKIYQYGGALVLQGAVDSERCRLERFHEYFASVAETHKLDFFLSLPADGEAPEWRYPEGSTGSPCFASLWSVCRCACRPPPASSD
jgi:hypothetical protein